MSGEDSQGLTVRGLNQLKVGSVVFVVNDPTLSYKKDRDYTWVQNRLDGREVRKGPHELYLLGCKEQRIPKPGKKRR